MSDVKTVFQSKTCRKRSYVTDTQSSRKQLNNVKEENRKEGSGGKVVVLVV